MGEGAGLLSNGAGNPLYRIQCIVHSVHCVHCTLLVQCTVHSVHCLYSVQCTVHPGVRRVPAKRCAMRHDPSGPIVYYGAVQCTVHRCTVQCSAVQCSAVQCTVQSASPERHNRRYLPPRKRVLLKWYVTESGQNGPFTQNMAMSQKLTS
jgi:hypothetical protein